MQHTLTFVKDKIKYVSKPFDFEAMCIINDAHNDENKKGPLSICRDALDYMFEGTDATQDIINSVDVNERAKMCLVLWGFYVDALSSKKRVTSGGSGVLRDIYTMFLTYHHILPDEVGRQNPWVLFKMLDGLNEDTVDYDNEHLRMFYGEEV